MPGRDSNRVPFDRQSATVPLDHNTSISMIMVPGVTPTGTAKTLTNKKFREKIGNLVRRST